MTTRVYRQGREPGLLSFDSFPRAAAALVFAYLLAFVLPLYGFLDRQNYVAYANSAGLLLQQYGGRGLVALLSNEPLWLYINEMLGRVLDAEGVVRTIIFSSAAVFFFFFTRSDRRFTLLLIVYCVAFPQIIKDYVIHLRQGAALAMFAVAMFYLRGKWQWVGLTAAALTHSSYLFIMFLLGLNIGFRFFNIKTYTKLILVAGIAIFLSAAVQVISGFLGARQANEYDFDVVAVSGLGFVFWAFILVIFLMEGKRYLEENIFEVSILAFYLGTYFLLAVTARVFESGLPVVLVAGLRLSRNRRRLFIAATVIFAAVSWVQRFSLPQLGFGSADAS